MKKLRHSLNLHVGPHYFITKIELDNRYYVYRFYIDKDSVQYIITMYKKNINNDFNSYDYKYDLYKAYFDYMMINEADFPCEIVERRGSEKDNEHIYSLWGPFIDPTSAYSHVYQKVLKDIHAGNRIMRCRFCGKDYRVKSPCMCAEKFVRG